MSEINRLKAQFIALYPSAPFINPMLCFTPTEMKHTQFILPATWALATTARGG
jgi:hypothetical protein